MEQENRLRVVTAFSGYDSQCMALDRLGIPYELIAWSEIDPYAIKAHNAVYPQWVDRNLGDISKVDWTAVPDFDLFTYSFPCTDISIAGKQEGLEEGSGTRSSLLWECRKVIQAKHPKWLVMENVKDLVNRKHRPFFDKWVEFLESEGYHTDWHVLNARNYGIPQNRERIFAVSQLRFQFPQPVPLELTLDDVLDDDVPEQYYISEDKLQSFQFDEKFKVEYEKLKASGVI